MVTNADGQEVARVDYIRELAGQGLTRGQIARQLEVSYQTVYAATRQMAVKSAAEARAEAAEAAEE
jgi:DNA-binding NarL/FixJ family response regulator